MAATELFKWMDHENREHLSGILNICWNQEYLPDEALAANVASIFKKGGTKKLENYRPISLMNTTYKILAAALQRRMEEGVESHLQRTQYGFRKKEEHRRHYII